jgi:transglutaminase/protease-like cytokinesis protein 3
MITQELLNSISELVKTQPVSEQTVESLRNSFPDFHFTYCMDDDVVGAIPVLEDPAFNLYLVSKSSHCLSLTQDMSSASGLVVAEIEEEWPFM